jgi:hypothetical protein
MLSGIGDRIRNQVKVELLKIAEWESEAKQVKRESSEWARLKKEREESIKKEERIARVLNAIKAENDPEPKEEIIENRVTTDGHYIGGTRWFLDSDQFAAWRDATPDDPSFKPVLWLRGCYGTGKTTIMSVTGSVIIVFYQNLCRYHTISALKQSGVKPLGQTVRIVPYYCFTTSIRDKPPNCETVIRALSSRMSFLPSLRFAGCAGQYFEESNSMAGKDKACRLRYWKGFLEKLLAEDNHDSLFLIVIDALDECDDSEESQDVGELLNFIDDIIGRHDNVRLLCSAREHVRVDDYISSDL